MLKSKKAIESYILILLLVAVVISFFLFFILDGIYGKQNKDCFKIDYKITDICTNSNSVQFSIKNNAPNLLLISFDKKIDLKDTIEPKSSGVLGYTFTNNNVEVIPFIRDKGVVNYCSGKKISQNVRLITKKC